MTVNTYLGPHILNSWLQLGEKNEKIADLEGRLCCFLDQKTDNPRPLGDAVEGKGERERGDSMREGEGKLGRYKSKLTTFFVDG